MRMLHTIYSLFLLLSFPLPGASAILETPSDAVEAGGNLPISEVIKKISEHKPGKILSSELSWAASLYVNQSPSVFLDRLKKHVDDETDWNSTYGMVTRVGLDISILYVEECCKLSELYKDASSEERVLLAEEFRRWRVPENSLTGFASNVGYLSYWGGTMNRIISADSIRDIRQARVDMLTAETTEDHSYKGTDPDVAKTSSSQSPSCRSG